MYGLTRIVLLNSFIPNRLCQADCEGNINFSGDNGAGKSSMLQLIPFFWGAEPFNLMRPVKRRKSFIDWYLPHSSSMVIFEYLREDGHHFVMVYRHVSREAPVYRFAKGSFDAALIGASSSELFKSLSAGEIIHALNNNGYDVSSQIESVVHYRAIIQHDRQLLKEHDNKGNFKQLAVRYSVPGPQGHMRHMEKLTHAVLKRSKLLESLKVMIGSILKEQSIAIPAQPTHSENERVREDLSCLRGFNQKRAYFRSVINDFHEKLLISKQFVTLSGKLQFTEQNQKIELNSAETEYQSCTKTLTELENNHAENYRSLNKRKIEAENSREAARGNLRTLENERLEYDSKDISLQMAEHGLLVFYKGELKQAQERSHVMLSAVDEIKYRHYTIVEQEKSNHQTFLTKLSENSRSIADSNTSIQTELNKKIQEFNDKKSSERSSLQTSYSKDIENLVSLVAQERTRAQNIAETEEQRRDLAAQEQSLDDLAAKLHMSKQELKKHDRDCASEEINYNNSLKDLEKFDKNIISFDADLAALQSQLEPGGSTFLAALKANDPEWHKSIGKIISPRLLNRIDLEPTKIDATNTFYGWSVNLDNLDVPAHAKSDAQIKNDIQLVDRQLQIERTNQVKCEKVTEAALLTWNNRKKNKDEIYRQSLHLENLQQHQTLQLKQLKNQIESYKHAQKILALEAEKNAQKDLQELKLLLLLKEKELDERYTSLIDHEQNLAAAMLIDNTMRLDELNEEKRDSKERHNLLLASLNKDFLDACENHGYSRSAIEKIESEIKELINRVERVEGYAPMIDQYIRWEKNEWSKRDSYSQIIQATGESIAGLIDEIGRDERLYKSQNTRLISRQKEIFTNIARRKEDLYEIDLVLKKLGRFASNHPLTSESLSDLFSEANTCLNRDIELKSSIQKGMSGAREIIERFPKSELRNAWEILCQRRATIAGIDPSDPKLTEYLPQDLEYLIDNNLPQLQKVTVEKVRAIGHQIENLYSGFIKIKQSISTLGRRIDDAIQSNQIIDNLRDIHIDIRATIESQEFWNEIFVFNQQWIEWQTTNPSELPGISLENALSEALSTLKAAKISNELESYFSMSINLIENGELREISSDNDLNTASSNGLSYLAICILFRGLTRFLCADENIKIHWPIDELAILSPQNITKLFKMLNDSGIFFFSGFPSTDPHLLNHFDTRKIIDMRVGIKQINLNMPTRLHR
ncbi:MAG: ATP-binding protein [Pseudomonadota bacterium]